MTPTQPLTVTLEAQQWQIVMNVLSDGPYRISAPLIQAIQQQCMQQDEAPAMRGNGISVEERPEP